MCGSTTLKIRGEKIMTIEIQSVKFDASLQLTQFIETKLSKLERLLDKITTAEVVLKLDKDIEHGNKVVLITILVPGDKLFAERKSKSFEEATDDCIDALKKQIEKYKDKQ